MYENECLDSLLVRQLKHRGFICNALNYLYILFFIQIYLFLFDTSYKFSFVNLIDFCCSFLFLGFPIFLLLFFISSFLKEKLNYQHSFVYKISKHNCNQISTCSYVLEHFFIFVNVIVK
jgi:threonine/homoserine/homoserine lactone efflux protein